MLASALRRNIGDGAFENLQQRLLHALTGDVARDGGVLVLAPDLVDLVDVDDAALRAGYVAVGGLQQLQNDVFDVLAHVAGFGQRRRIDDGKRHVQHLRQRLRQQRLARSRRPDQQDVRLRQLDIVAARLVHLDALVVVVDRHRQLLLRLVLTDHVLVQKCLDLLRLGQVGRSCTGLCLGAVVFENRVADGNALIADISSRIVRWRRDQLGNGILRLVAERAAKRFV